MPEQDQLLEKEVGSLKLQVSKVAEARDDATGLTAEKNGQVKMLEARTRLFKNALDSLELRDSIHCSQEHCIPQGRGRQERHQQHS